MKPNIKHHSCQCGGRQRRRSRRSRVCISHITIVLLLTSDQTCAFHRREQKDDNVIGPVNKQRVGVFKPLQSISNIAERGASTWGNYISTKKGNKQTKSMNKALSSSSTLYITKLHERFQNQKSTITSDIKEKIDHIGETPSEHITQDIIAYVLGSATTLAGSAFASTTIAFFLGTAVMALGAIATIFFTDDTEKAVYSLMNEEEEENIYILSDGEEQHTIEPGDGCDYNGEGQKVILPAERKLPSEKLDTFMQQELRRCYINGKPQNKVLNFAENDIVRDVCIAHEDTSISRNHLIVTDAEEVLLAAEAASSQTEAIEEDVVPKRVEVVWHDTDYAGDQNAHYYTASQSTKEHHQKRSKPRRVASKPRNNKQTNEEQWAKLTERDGALLLAQSFRVASSMFGLLGDGVRFAGESAAATAGGISRLAGGAVRLSGWAIGSLGEAIENSGHSRAEEGEHQRLAPNEESTSENPRVLKRQVAGSSVRLIGDAIDQVADSLLLAGSATERVAFGVTSAAEGCVRIVQDFTSQIATMFSKEGERNIRITRPEINEELDEVVDDTLRQNAAEEDPTKELQYEMKEANGDYQERNALAKDGELLFVQSISAWIMENADILDETEGVPSLAPEMLGVFLVCYLLSVYILAPTTKKKESLPITSYKEDKKRPVREISFIDKPVMRHNSIEVVLQKENDQDSHTSTITLGSTKKHGLDSQNVEQSQPSPPNLLTKTYPIYLVIVLPFKLAWSIISSKKTLLLVFYFIGWAFLCRVHQYKASVIQRRSELGGYKRAVESTLSLNETTFWLNTIITRLWVIESGGLEPPLSLSASEILAESLKHPYSKPSVVAHVSLDTLTFGSSPPLISRLTVTGIDVDESIVFMELDVGLLMHDAVLLLDIKPSSLEYRSLPSTKVSINSLDAKATLNLSVKCSPDYPYVSFLTLSLVEVPDFNLKIEPQSESGLKGIDFASFPIVSKWIKSSINTVLSSYLAPQYISIDILAWLRGEDKIVTYFES